MIDATVWCAAACRTSSAWWACWRARAGAAGHLRDDLPRHAHPQPDLVRRGRHRAGCRLSSAPSPCCRAWWANTSTRRSRSYLSERWP
ncbi:unnamed protein product [Leptidea sinapis]|uniref:Uncharacterized protein n=1 Tax=Leptidea sinapis TaxID=189913 RepID=A0A5E4PVX5_9NEOP|nr:unnamed protein product [Leptidea sinapis]